MADLTRSVAAPPTPLHPAPVADRQPPNPLSPTRRQAILRAAVRLFARDGFANVEMEDIGDAVGISGPSLYNHFDTKVDILVAAMLRGNEPLRTDMHRQLDRRDRPPHHQLLRVCIRIHRPYSTTDLRSDPAPDRGQTPDQRSPTRIHIRMVGSAAPTASELGPHRDDHWPVQFVHRCGSACTCDRSPCKPNRISNSTALPSALPSQCG
ncbi:TetR/AcrR family transcriptional regulator [Nocardia sp. NPDC047648]|uniref:TetR/AcrR family transcriptional regulator n=1 Tax=Nocardia sp. NPDC047648 TaxID=3155625 RepID=UPI0033CC1378